MLKRGLITENPSSTIGLFIVADLLALVTGSMLSGWIRLGEPLPGKNYILATSIGVALALVFLAFNGAYTSWRSDRIGVIVRKIVMSMSQVFLILVALAYITKTSDTYSRQWMVVWYLMALTLLAINRGIVYLLLHQVRKLGWDLRGIVIVGFNDISEKLVDKIQSIPWIGVKIKHIVDMNNSNKKSYKGIKIVKGIDTFADSIKGSDVDEVWIVSSASDNEIIDNIIHSIRHETVSIRWVPNLDVFRQYSNNAPKIFGIPIIDLGSNRLVGLNSVIKLLEDYVLGILSLVVAAPIMVLVAIAIKMESSGPVIFKQIRHGWNGEEIEVWKFRSMYAVAGKDEAVYRQAEKDDERVTRVGRIIRKTSLDELPQLFNLLQGRLSLVGPRPHPVELNEKYMEEIEKYMHRHKIRPGITGLAQVRGLRGETKTVDDMRKRIESDLEYIDTWSLWLDIKILIQTVFVVITGKNAY